ncbi:MAG: hypothetical protein H0U37_11385 [Chloroflexi bacterium]|nr:hypothetical protein [Chloroflexota bacterium]
MDRDVAHWLDVATARPFRERLATIVALAAIVAGLLTISVGRFDSGVRLMTLGDRVVVADVQPRSIAAQNGLRVGMVVTSLQGVTLVRLPQFIYPSAAPTPDPATGELTAPGPIGIDPPQPIITALDPAMMADLLARPTLELEAVDGAVIDASQPDSYGIVSLYDNGLDGVRMTLPFYVLGIVLLALVGWWLASGRAGDNLRALAGPMAVAVSVPFLVRPLDATWSASLFVLSGVLIALGVIPLALTLADRVDDHDDQRLVTFAALGCALGAAVVAVIASGMLPWSGEGFTRWALAGAAPLIPGLAAAGPIARVSIVATPSRRLLESTEYAVLGATPAVALASDGAPFPFPLALWFLLILAAGRFTVRPLARLATRAVLQRDLVVAATEAERARVAADIHDDALQELTLLVHRLDAAGDTQGAELARTVSDRLRAICGDLRLPILDDLGVGPALDWLVLRIERLAGGEVRLERSDGARPPANVELAFFRVAQEALANAVKHGRPPILVRYATTPAGASLSIDDAGTGIEPDAGAGAERAGHFGILNMQQRAEAIGAILDVRRWPSGGTHVALEWRSGQLRTAR